MPLTWNIVDKWREKAGMEVAELARRADIPERTVYAGVKSNSTLRRATRRAVAGVFPSEFKEFERKAS